MTAGFTALLLPGPCPWHHVQRVGGKGAAGLGACQEVFIDPKGREIGPVKEGCMVMKTTSQSCLSQQGCRFGIKR